MLINRFRIAELLKHGLLCVFPRFLCMSVFADGESADDGGSSTTAVNYEQLIALARKEEKEKLYPRIQKAETEARNTIASLNASLLEAGTLKAEIERLNGVLAQKSSNVEDSELVINLKAEIDRLKGELSTAQTASGAVDEQAIRAQIEAEYAVKFYREQQLADHKDSILEVFLEDVVGETNEEIDVAIAKAVEKSNSVKKSLGILDDEADDTSSELPAPKKTSKNAPKTSKKPPVGNPASSYKKDALNPDDIRNLDPRSPEYAELRKKMGLR